MKRHTKGAAAALAVLAIAGVAAVASAHGGPAAIRRRLGEHEDGGRHAARQALAAVARDHGRAGLDGAREPVGR